MRHRSLATSGPILAMAAGAWAILALSAAAPKPMELLVPAYFYPTAGDDWDRLRDAARRVPLTAILNPASGPGKVVDPNYVKAAKALRSAGGVVVAYVHTSYGARPLAAVEADVARYVGFYEVDGFFIDEMSNNLSDLDYYKHLYQSLKKIKPGCRVIGNPGAATPQAYLTAPAADTLVTFEGTGASYRAAKPPTHAGGYPTARLGAIVHGVATPAAMLDDLARAAGRDVALVYVTDNANPTNPYGRLPSYFDREVAALGVAPPLLGPSSVAAGLAIGIAALVARRLFRRRPVK